MLAPCDLSQRMPGWLSVAVSLLRDAMIDVTIPLVYCRESDPHGTESKSRASSIKERRFDAFDLSIDHAFSHHVMTDEAWPGGCGATVVGISRPSATRILNRDQSRKLNILTSSSRPWWREFIPSHLVSWYLDSGTTIWPRSFSDPGSWLQR